MLQVVETPNENVLRFVVDIDLKKYGPILFKKDDKKINSMLARILFKVSGIETVMITEKFISISKAEDKKWAELQDFVQDIIVDYLQANLSVFDDIEESSNNVNNDFLCSCTQDGELIEQIKKIIDEKIVPSLEMHGGSVVFKDFKDGVVFVSMQGSCVGCPSMGITLKSGIENLLKYYIPEIITVESI